MTNEKKYYLLLPLVCFLAAYALDKAFYIGGLEDYFLRTASFINYDRKGELLDELETYLKQPKRKKVLVVFGNSRTFSFDRKFIEKNHPDWVLFNFSVPGGNSDYYYHFMEKFQARNVKPDFIYFTVTPQGYNSTPIVNVDEAMVNGLPPGFVARNFTKFSVADLSNYVAKKLFWNYQYRPKLGVILKKLKKDKEHLKGFRKLRVLTYNVLKENRGSIPYYGGARDPVQNRPVQIAGARHTWKNHFRPFTDHESQYYFTDRFLKIAREMNVPATLLWARVGPELRRLKNTAVVRTDAQGKGLTVRAIWTKRITKLGNAYNADLLDMNYTGAMKCDKFYDESHLAAICFDEFTNLVFAHAEKKLRSKVGRNAAPAGRRDS